MSRKEAMSTIVAMVLIVLLTISLVSILWFFVVPFITDSLEGSTSEKASLTIIGSSGYTTWDEDSQLLSVQVEREIDETDLIGIEFIFTVNGTSESFIEENVLQPGTSKIYLFPLSYKPDSISIAPIYSGGEGNIVSTTSDIKDSQDIGTILELAALESLTCMPGFDGENIVICSCTDLQNIKNNLSANYVLGQNIDCSSFDNFESIGEGVGFFGFFKGSLDGKGFSISNLKIYGPEDYYYTGLFSGLKNAKISNLALIDANITGNNAVGIISGNFESGSTIENVYTSGRVEGTRFVGGLVGYSALENGDSSIINSYSTANVIANERTAGGIVGVWGEYGGFLSIKNSFATGIVSVEDSRKIGEGALVGTNWASKSQISNSAYFDRGIPCTWKGVSGECSAKLSLDYFKSANSEIFSSWNSSVWNFVDGEYPALKSLEIINGICSEVEVNSCEAGIFRDVLDDGSTSLWACLGENGGFDVECNWVESTIGKDYYVSSIMHGRSDSNLGTDPNKPWASFDKVKSMWSSLNPGDTVHLERGSVWEISQGDYWRMISGGNITYPKTIRGDDYGNPSLHTPVLRRSSGSGGAFILVETSHVVIRDFELDGDNSGTSGITVFAYDNNLNDREDITIRNMNIHDLGGSSRDYVCGIWLKSDFGQYSISNVLIDGNNISGYSAHGLNHYSVGDLNNITWRNNIVNNSYGGGRYPGANSALQVNSGGGEGSLFEDNYLRDTTTEEAALFGFNKYGKSDSTPNIFRNNIIIDSGSYGILFTRDWDGVGTTSDETQMWDIYNNLVYNSKEAGFAIHPYSGYGSGSSFRIYNNLFFKSSKSEVSLKYDDGDTRVDVFNNIFYTGCNEPILDWQSSFGGSFNHGNNLFWHILGTSKTAVNKKDISLYSVANVKNFESSGQNTNPLFVNVNNLDFHLGSGSLAINTGASLGSSYAVALDGVSRPQGFAWDIGPYEVA